GPQLSQGLRGDHPENPAGEPEGSRVPRRAVCRASCSYANDHPNRMKRRVRLLNGIRNRWRRAKRDAALPERPLETKTDERSEEGFVPNARELEPNRQLAQAARRGSAQLFLVSFDV